MRSDVTTIIASNGFLGRRMAVIWLRDVRIVRCAIPNRATLPLSSDTDIGVRGGAEGEKPTHAKCRLSEYNDFHLIQNQTLPNSATRKKMALA